METGTKKTMTDQLSSSPKQFLLNPTRSARQGVQINIGKFGPEYEKIVTTMEIHPDDMAALGVVDGDWIVVSTEIGSAEFCCKSANVPIGMLVVPYGPPTCKLMSGDTGGTGMPLSKGWDVTAEKIEKPAQQSTEE